MNYHDLLSNKTFFLFLLEIDANIRDLVKSGGCRICAGTLDCANFKRSGGYGIPTECEGECLLRFSLCCRSDGCRKRHTTPSVRFLPFKSYLSLIIILISTLQHGINDKRVKALSQALGVSRDTVRKWRVWWLDKFCTSPYWKGIRGIVMPTENKPTVDIFFATFEKSYPHAEASLIMASATLTLYLHSNDCTEIRNLIHGLVQMRYFPQT